MHHTEEDIVMVASELARLAKVAGLSVGITLIVYHELGYVDKIEGHSMQPTFNPYWGKRNESIRQPAPSELSRGALLDVISSQVQNDWVVINKWVARDKRNLRVGDVVVLTSPKNPRSTLIKRIAAMPGDLIQILETGEMKLIDEGYCWVEGDNQQPNYDSNEFGQIPLGLIVGRVCYIIWPLERIRKLDCDPTISLRSMKTSLVNFTKR